MKAAVSGSACAKGGEEMEKINEKHLKKELIKKCTFVRMPPFNYSYIKQSGLDISFVLNLY